MERELGGGFRPAVSIILATNRGGPYLGETLRSVSAQTFADWELVLVDDGSDEPDEIRRAVVGLNNVQVIRQDNAGISIARNVGFAHSRGSFIAYLDDDDVWDPRRLERQVDALCRDESAGCCHSGYWFMDGDGARFGNQVDVVPASTASYLSGAVDTPRINTLLLRREIVERLGGFLSSFILYEDCEFVLRVVREAPVISLPDQLVGWRRYPESVSFTYNPRLMNAAAVHSVTVSLWGAQMKEDQAEGKMLMQNIERTKRRLAEFHAARFCHLVRTGHLRHAGSELIEGMANSPVAVVRKCADIARHGN
jgi:glycosyltransferase involved in cell wall biosynthesis